MPFSEPSLTIGVEEEYLIVDPVTRDLAEPPDEAFNKCGERLKNLVKPEFMKSQIEVATRVCGTIKEIRNELIELRSVIAEVMGEYDLAPIAASTHPFASWETQLHTDKERYNILAENMQAVARRLLINGMHVHVGVEDNEMRIEMMSQVAYFLPHLLALSTSSPFWRGELTGLKSYRLCVFDELPRSGLPERFESYGEYSRHVAVLVESGLIKDATMLWWDVRPSATFPTLEMRITDICTRIDDTVCLAAIYLCIIRMLYRLRRGNQKWRTYTNMLINENRWRAQRYGIDEGMVDFGKGTVVPFAELLEELFEIIEEDAEALACVDEVLHARNIMKTGTSAHRQLATFEKTKAASGDEQKAFHAVVDELIAETVKGF
ncbi:MAG: carboxylate-amine ligase [Rhodospirillales bacterium]|nr:carboxylate-amine ligase [Rhodospirillaceae bacterium]MDP6429096.1 carboxylate-amine ligase [Rhodospirillales bacterium]MDP6645773.1 carboxylate-amine ligase [Rhodospirillales bacterium]MDP6843493.1 carboxylate-amine ligase [Rhodospirillales bacterium]